MTRPWGPGRGVQSRWPAGRPPWRPPHFPARPSRSPRMTAATRGHIGVSGVDGPLVSLPGALHVPLIGKPRPEVNCRLSYHAMPGVDGLLVGRSGSLLIPPLGQQNRENDRSHGSHVGVPGVDRLLEGRPGPLHIPPLDQQAPENGRGPRALLGVAGVDGLLEGRSSALHQQVSEVDRRPGEPPRRARSRSPAARPPWPPPCPPARPAASRGPPPPEEPRRRGRSRWSAGRSCPGTLHVALLPEHFS